MPYPPTMLARLLGTTLGLLTSAACASAQSTTGQSSSPQPPPEAPAAAPAAGSDSSRPAWLVADDAAKTVTIALVVTRGPGGAVINGARAGELQVVVPQNWTVQWDWRSADSTTPHSLVVMEEREKLPAEGGRAVFTNAMTRMVTAGLAVGQVDRTTFTADQAGWFWLLCGVPGHALGGEFLGLRVDPDARTASVKRK